MNKSGRFILTALGVVGVLVAVVLLGSEKVLGSAIALNSAFSGLLALTGFMFTARTFITFKLNEAVYGNESYQKQVEEFQKDGAYQSELYEPLKKLDSTLGQTCLFCFGTLFSLVLFSLIPNEWGNGTSLWAKIATRCAGGTESISGWFVTYQVLTTAAYGALIAAIVHVFYAILRVNRNIRGIIDEWEKKYKAEKENRKPASTPPKA